MTPTSTSTRALRTSLLVTENTNIATCLGVLAEELGLPKSASGLVGPGSRSKASRSSLAGAGTEDDERIRWTIRLGDRDLKPGDPVLSAVQHEPGAVMTVAVNQEWLYEPSPSLSVRRNGPRDPIDQSRPEETNVTEADEEEEGEQDDTLKAARAQMLLQGSPTALSPVITTPTQPRPTTRLSSLFHASVETHQHPAPPTTPQMTLAAGDVAGDLADAIADALSDAASSDGLPPSGERDARRRSLDAAGPGPARLLFSKAESTASLSIADAGPPSPSPHAFISLSTGSGASMTKLLAQNASGSTPTVAESWSKRFSLPGFGSLIGSPTPSPAPSVVLGDGSEVGSIRSSVQRPASGSIRPLEKQATGGLWGWWTGSSRAEEGSAEAYIQGLNIKWVNSPATRRRSWPPNDSEAD